MKFDLWMPTASPMTTAGLLDAVAEGAEERGIGTIWVGEHVVLFEQYESHYPYAEDGRIPAPPGSGLLEPMVTLTYLAARTSTRPPRHGHAAPPPAQSRLHGQGGQLARLALRRAGRPRHRRGLAQGGVRRAQRALGAPGPPHGRVPRGPAHALGSTTRRPSTARSTTCPHCQMFPKPVQQPPPVHIGGETSRRAAAGGPPRAGLAHLQPLARRARRRPGRARRGARRPSGAAGPTCASRCAPTSTS